MLCKLRSVVVWALAGLTFFTCLASFRYFTATTRFDRERAILPPAPLAASSAPPVTTESVGSMEMRWRRKVLQLACQKEAMDNVEEGVVDPALEDLIYKPRKLRNIIVDDERKVLYCYVPKVACTNWKRIMMILTGVSNETQPLAIPADSAHRDNVFIKLNDLEPEEVRHRLLTYSKFLFVRNPAERILSAFRNKFEKNYTSSAYFKKHFAINIMRRYRKKGEVPPSGHGLKFTEFVRYLQDTKVENQNEHWAPFSYLCHPCVVKYDYIGRYETLEEDAQYILEKIGAPLSLHFPPVMPSSTTPLVEPYYDKLTKRQLRGLLKVYKNDFKMFNYHFRDMI